MALVATSCLLPQDGNVLPIVDSSNPPRKNRAPRILATQPSTDTSYFTTAECAQQTFSVTVTDPDDSDQIRSLWFVNPTNDFTAAPGHPIVAGAIKPMMPGGVHIESPMIGLDALGTLAPNTSDNLLVVVISDGEFVAAGQKSGPDQNGYDTAPHGEFPLQDGGCETGLEIDRDAGLCIDPSYTVKATWRVTPTGCPK